MYDSNLDGLRITQITLETEYECCIFTNCDFSEIDLRDVAFEECQFSECNFTNAKIKNTAFKNVSFTNSKLLGLHFTNSNPFLFEVIFSNCSLDYASFYQLNLKDTIFNKCGLKEVDFVEANLNNATFDECDLHGAIFENTNLEKCDFRTAQNYSLDPAKNLMKGAKFLHNGLVGLLTQYGLDIKL